MLNVLHISESDAQGGAAQCARNLHEGLQARGQVSRMLVGRVLTDDPTVRPLKRGVAWRAADRLAGAIPDRLSLQYLFYPSSFALAGDTWFREADVLQLHNLHGSYFSHTALPWLTRRKPTVWLLHDMWAFTGHVGYSYDCERWRAGCGSCPYLGEYPALRRDTSAFLWRHKRRTYARSRLTVVTPSEWLGGLARSSPLLAGHDVRVIPYGVDLSLWRPVPKAAARAELGVPPDERIVLVSAADLGERRKGADLARAALAQLEDLDFAILAAGRREPELGRKTYSMGTVLDERRMALVYSAADVFVLPTRAENRSVAAIESLACGTPCVSFAVGGTPETVRHLETGYLAAPEDAGDLARGIRALLEDDALRARLAGNARALAEQSLSLDLQVARQLDLYSELVGAG